MNLLEDAQGDLPGIDTSKNYVEELVGDGKKFKTVEDLARGKYEADLYVETLKKRQDEINRDYLRLREENMAKQKLEDLIDQFSKLQSNNQNNDNTYVKPEIKNELDLKQVESLLESRLDAREAARKQQENFALVKEKLKERFGSNYSTVVKEQISDLGITESEFNDMAVKHPKLLFKTLGLDKAPNVDSFQAPPRSNQRSNSFAPTTEKRTWSYYQKMKETNPNLYLDPKIAVQMHNDAIALGESFQDGDFKRSF